MSENKTKAPEKAPQAAPQRGPGRRNSGPASMSQIKGSIGSLKRVMKIYVGYFPKLSWVIFLCIFVGAVTAAVPSIFQKNILTIIKDTWESGNWEAARPQVLSYLIPLVCLYVIALALAILQSQVIAFMTQKFLARLREDLFDTKELNQSCRRLKVCIHQLQQLLKPEAYWHLHASRSNLLHHRFQVPYKQAYRFRSWKQHNKTS